MLALRGCPNRLPSRQLETISAQRVVVNRGGRHDTVMAVPTFREGQPLRGNGEQWIDRTYGYGAIPRPYQLKKRA